MAVDEPESSDHAQIEVCQLAHSSFEVVSIDLGAVDVEGIGAEKDRHGFAADGRARCQQSQGQIMECA